MSEQKELTYILGAGASYQSMPVVATFADRFSEFESAISKATNERGVSTNDDSDLIDFRLRIRSLSSQFQTHQSFDTYFKKLFHTAINEEIIIAKKILNLYFTWEHLTVKDAKKEEQLFRKTATIDNRYDALIAGLLKPKKGIKETYCKINFISWNYDLNLFYSLKNYFSPETRTDEFLSEIKVDDFEWNIQNQISVYNINGYYYNSILKDKRRLIPEGKTENSIIQKVKDGFLEEKEDDLIKFAWENDNLSFINHACEAIKKSSNVVIIGYTFPLYNRLLDITYLNRDDFYENQKTFYIQDPNSEEIKRRILDTFNLESSNPIWNYKLKTETDCKTFFVPSNLFNPIQTNQIFDIKVF